jgi:hypothetical protein
MFGKICLMEECDRFDSGSVIGQPKYPQFDCVLTLHVSCLSYTQTQPQTISDLSEYERYCQEKIARNKAKLEDLGFGEPKKEKKSVNKKRSLSPRVYAPRRVLPFRERKTTSYNEDDH